MKTHNISSTVMDRVAQFEERRISWWQKLFVSTVLLLASGALVFTWFAYREFALGDFGSLFVLFGEDWEIIRDYWQDTFSTIWVELPKGYMVLAALLLAGIGVFVYSTGRSRRIIRKKKYELTRLQQKEPHG